MARERMLIRMCVVFAVSGCMSHAQVDLGGTTVPKDRIIVYLFIGHSNMAGRSSETDTETHPRAWNYDILDDGGTWTPARAPIHPDNYTNDRGGPGMPFLKKMVDEYPDYYFGILQNANSAAYIDDYHKGETLYDEIIDAANALKDNVTIGGVLTMLGMQEARQSRSSQADAEAVAEDFTQLISDMRSDLGMSDLPFYIGRFEENCDRYKNGEAAYGDIVQQELRSIPDLVSYCAVIESDGPYEDDHHFSYQGHVQWADSAVSLIQTHEWFPHATVDNESPSTPAGLTQQGRTATSVTISWDASTDNVFVEAYDIYRDGVQVGSVDGSTTEYTSTGLTSGTTYAFTVRARDAAGNVSAHSSELSATTETNNDTEPPSAPGDLTVTARTATSITLSWEAARDNVAVEKYAITYGTSGSDDVDGDVLSYTASGLTSATEYTCTVVAVDAAGNQSSAATVTDSTTEIEMVEEFPFKVNCGGPAAHGYLPDTRWVDGGTYGYTGSQTDSTWWGRTHGGEWISTQGTEEDSVYAYVRHGQDLGYRVSLPNATYMVSLLFAEYWRDTQGERVFDVAINGTAIDENPIDIVAAAGPTTAYVVETVVPVTEKHMAVDFTPQVDNPMISGMIIEQMPAFELLSPVGGETYRVGDTMTVRWNADLVRVQDAMVALSVDYGITYTDINSTFIKPEDDSVWGAFSFEIDDSLLQQRKDNCLVMVYSYGKTYFTQSDSTFQILPEESKTQHKHARHTTRQLTMHHGSNGYVLVVPNQDRVDVRVCTVHGRTIAARRVTGPGSFPIRTRNTGKGMHIVEITGGGRHITKKMCTH